MKRSPQRAAAALLLWLVAMVSGCGPAPESEAGEKITWVQQHAEGLRLAKETGKPALIYFTADWCAPCVELKKTIWPDRRVVEASQRLVMIYVDVDKDPETFAAYRVRGIPAILFLSPQAEKVTTFSGDRSAANLARQMNAAAQNFSK